MVMNAMGRLKAWFRGSSPPVLAFKRDEVVVVKRCKTCGKPAIAWRVYASGHVACIPCARNL